MRVSKWSNSLAVPLSRSLVNDLDLKAGDHLDIVSASPGRLAIARDERRLPATERMRARALPIPDDYAFDRDEANAR